MTARYQAESVHALTYSVLWLASVGRCVANRPVLRAGRQAAADENISRRNIYELWLSIATCFMSGREPRQLRLLCDVQQIPPETHAAAEPAAASILSQYRDLNGPGYNQRADL